MKKRDTQLLNELIDGIIQAEGAASQLIHTGGNPRFWMIIRDALDLTKEGCIAMSPHNALVAPKTVFV